MSIKNWPSAERPREKLLQGSAAGLSDAELLAVFLGSGRRGLDAVAFARSQLAEHGGLSALLASGSAALVKRLGSVTACRVLAGLELGVRALQSNARERAVLSDPNAAGNLFRQRLADRPNEVFACAFLDSRHRLIAYQELFQGGVDGAEIHPREVVRECLRHNAAALLVAHNHPSGCAEPSTADRLVTQRLREALSLIDVRLLDHLVVGDGIAISLAARGWI